MTFFSKRKRKNDDPPRFPAWVIVLIAIGLVIIVELIFQPASSTSSLVVNQPQGDIELTATYIIQQATAMAQGTPQPGLSPSNNTLDPIEMTATFIVKQATQQAGTPNS